MADGSAPRTDGLLRLSASTLGDVLLGAGVAIGFGVVAGLLSVGLMRAGVDLGAPIAGMGGLPALLIPISLIGTLLAGLLLWGLHRSRLPASPRPWTPRMAVEVVAVALLLQAAAIAFTALTEHFGTTTTGTNLAIIEAAFAAAPLFTVLMTVLIAPIGEELVFRRVLLHRFAQARRPWLGLIVTSFGFALIHEPLPGDRALLAWALTLATYASLGLGLGALYLRSGRLDAVILAHVLINAVGVGLLLA